MILRKFDLIYHKGSVPIYHELLVHIDDACKDNWLTDSTKTVQGLVEVYLFVVDKLVHDMSKRAEIYVSTDTLYNILDEFRNGGWSYEERAMQTYSNGDFKMEFECQMYPSPCEHCNGTTYYHSDVTQGKCFHCAGSGTKRTNKNGQLFQSQPFKMFQELPT